MKATIDIPDQLYRRVKARAAMDGRAVREVTIDLYQAWLDDRPATPAPVGSAIDEWLARWAALGEEVHRASVDERPVSEIIATEQR